MITAERRTIVKEAKKILLVIRAGLWETFTDRKGIILLVLLGFILDNGVRPMVKNAMTVGKPLGVFEGFLMCMNNWYYLVIFLIGFVLLLTSVPRLDNNQFFLIYRTGKKNWLYGEIFQITISAVGYVMLLFCGCLIAVGKYSFIGNVWSDFTVYYKSEYEELLSDNYHFIDQQVFKYYLPYQAVLHSILLIILCMTLMGTVILFFAIINKKLIGIILNVIFILFVLIFNDYRAKIMWISPFCHAVLALHNIYVFKQRSIPLLYSYLYLILLEGLMIFLSLRKLKTKIFY
jgi:hypothetical protein